MQKHDKTSNNMDSRARNGTIDCCRHQMENNRSPCVDPPVQGRYFKRTAIYDKVKANNLGRITTVLKN